MIKESRANSRLHSLIRDRIVSCRRSTRACTQNNISKILSCRRSQVTIFIIVAIILIAAVVGFFLIFYKIKPQIFKPSITEPQSYIDKCAKDAASEAIEIMMPQGGYIEPRNYRLYKNDKIAYLCYTNLFYKTCVMQEPVYIKHLEDEITEYIAPKIESCFQYLKEELEKQDYKIDMGDMKTATELATKIVRINIERVFVMSKNEETRKFDLFKTAFNSPLYNLAITAIEIANQEAKYCNFEYLGYMVFYPEFNIDKKSVGQGQEASKIYIIQDRYTGKKLNIAIRSCAIPAGF